MGNLQAAGPPKKSPFLSQQLWATPISWGGRDIRDLCVRHSFQEGILWGSREGDGSDFKMVNYVIRTTFPNTTALAEWFLFHVQSLFFIAKMVLGEEIWGRWLCHEGIRVERDTWGISKSGEPGGGSLLDHLPGPWSYSSLLTEPCLPGPWSYTSLLTEPWKLNLFLKLPSLWHSFQSLNDSHQLKKWPYMII